MKTKKGFKSKRESITNKSILKKMRSAILTKKYLVAFSYQTKRSKLLKSMMLI